MCLVRITNAILDNDNSILTLSVYDEDRDLYYGKPAILDKNGIKEIIDLDLTDYEKERLNKSINIVNEIKNNL